MTSEIVHEMKRRYGSRFVKQATIIENGQEKAAWQEISHGAAKDKVSHAIRYFCRSLAAEEEKRRRRPSSQQAPENVKAAMDWIQATARQNKAAGASASGRLAEVRMPRIDQPTPPAQIGHASSLHEEEDLGSAAAKRKRNSAYKQFHFTDHASSSSSDDMATAAAMLMLRPPPPPSQLEPTEAAAASSSLPTTAAAMLMLRPPPPPRLEQRDSTGTAGASLALQSATEGTPPTAVTSAVTPVSDERRALDETLDDACVDDSNKSTIAIAEESNASTAIIQPDAAASSLDKNEADEKGATSGDDNEEDDEDNDGEWNDVLKEVFLQPSRLRDATPKVLPALHLNPPALAAQAANRSLQHPTMYNAQDAAVAAAGMPAAEQRPIMMINPSTGALVPAYLPHQVATMPPLIPGGHAALAAADLSRY